jgi:hypothetical protein
MKNLYSNIALNKTATAIFLHIVKQCEAAEENALKIQNNDAFMPLHVELLYTANDGKIFSFSHYYEQNGDLVPDPDMTFLQYAKNPELIIPCTFQNSYTYQEVCSLEGGKWMVKSKRDLKSLVSFSNMWMKNIKEQQELKIERETA